MSAPRLLALSAAADGISAALMGAGSECLQHSAVGARGQAERLLALAQQLLAAAEWRCGQLDALVLACGPGPFTSLRVAAGVAQGLALGAGLPIVPVSSLATLAQGVLRRGPPLGTRHALALCHARSGQWYRGVYRLDAAASGVSAWVPDKRCGAATLALPQAWAWQHCVGVGDGWRQPPLTVRYCLQLIPEALPEARDAAQLGTLALAADDGAAVAAERAVPIYLCGEEAWRPAPSPWAAAEDAAKGGA